MVPLTANAAGAFSADRGRRRRHHRQQAGALLDAYDPLLEESLRRLAAAADPLSVAHPAVAAPRGDGGGRRRLCPFCSSAGETGHLEQELGVLREEVRQLRVDLKAVHAKLEECRTARVQTPMPSSSEVAPKLDLGKELSYKVSEDEARRPAENEMDKGSNSLITSPATTAATPVQKTLSECEQDSECDLVAGNRDLGSDTGLSLEQPQLSKWTEQGDNVPRESSNPQVYAWETQSDLGSDFGQEELVQPLEQPQRSRARKSPRREGNSSLLGCGRAVLLGGLNQQRSDNEDDGRICHSSAEAHQSCRVPGKWSL